MPTVAEFIAPLARWFPITTTYGGRTAAGPNAGSPHSALDLGATFGEPVYSIGTGKVVAPDDNPGRVTGGNTVTVDYGNGIKVLFAHLSEMYVKPGDTVAPGQRIGAVGNTGITTGGGGTRGSHLHVEAWEGTKHINPLDLFDYTREIDTKQYQASGKMCRLAIPFVGMNKDWWISPNPDGSCPLGYIHVDTESRFLDLSNTPGEDIAKGIDDTAKTTVDVAAAVLNPGNWARILAIVGGGVLVLVGGYMVWQST